MTNELLKILDTSEALFKKYGIRSVTMTDISQKLGVSKKTLYKYIENKHDLISKMMQRYIKQEQEACCQIMEEAKNALDQMLKINLYVQQQIKEVNPSMLYDLQKYHHPIWKMLEQFHQNYILGVVQQNLQQGVAEGIYRADLNTEIVAKFHVSMMPVISDSERFPHQAFATKDVHQEFIRYHFNGIISEKGRTTLKNLIQEYGIDTNII